MEILDRIDKLRLEKGWTINYLAMEAGLTQSTLNNLYVRHAEPKLQTLRAICNAFEITLSDFFKDWEDNTDEEVVKMVKRLSPANKAALLQLLKSMK